MSILSIPAVVIYEIESMNTTKEEDGLWHIAGIGAIGTLFATSLCRGGESVRLILKNARQLETYQSVPLKMNTESFEFTCHPPALTVQDLANVSIQNLICCTKAYDVSKLLLSLKDNLSPNSMIILIHNGMGVIEEVRQQLPHLRIISGITTLGGYLESPYTLRAFLNGSLYLGASLGRFSHDELGVLSLLFKKISVPYKWVNTIQLMIWEKFAINCSINMLTALFSCKNGELIQHQDLLSDLSAEIASVLVGYDIDISKDQLLQKVLEVIQHTAGNYSSMYQDIKNHRLTEIGYLNNYLAKLAAQKNIKVPVINRLLNQFYQQFPAQQTF